MDLGVGGELCGFMSPEVAGHPAFRGATVNWQKCEVDVPALEPILHAGKADGIPAVIDGEGSELNHVAEVVVASVFVLVQLFMSGGDTVKAEGPYHGVLSGVESSRHFGHDAEPIGHEGTVGFGHDQFHVGIGLEEWDERVGVEVVRMVMG